MNEESKETKQSNDIKQAVEQGDKIEDKEQKEAPIVYAKKLESISNEDAQYKEVKEKASELEKILKSTSNIKNNITKYLEDSDHPRKSEYNSIIEDIKKAEYTVKDENSHMNFLASKLFLTKEEVPTSLKRDYEALEHSNGLTPALKESVDRLKYITESAMERLNRESERHKLVDKFGNNPKFSDPKDFNSVLTDYDHGRISKEDFDKKCVDFLNATELKRKAMGI